MVACEPAWWFDSNGAAMSSLSLRSATALPPAIYLLSLCSFAFGLSEFIAAGLLSSMARELQASVAATGGAIAAYALGAAIGAPILTAMLARWPERQVLVATMAVLALGSLAMAAAPGLGPLLAVRFVVGLAHGVFMAVASHAATSLVDPARAGRALSIVWLGLTLALAGGLVVVALGLCRHRHAGAVWRGGAAVGHAQGRQGCRPGFCAGQPARH